MAAPTSLRRSRVFFSSADLILQRNEEARRSSMLATEEFPDETDSSSDMAAAAPLTMLRATSSTCSTMTNPNTTLLEPDWARNMTPSKGSLIDEEDQEEDDVYARSASSSSTIDPTVARHMDLSGSVFSAQEQALYESAVPMDVPHDIRSFVPTGAGLDSVMPLPRWTPRRAAATSTC